jgi:hypothetical protein
LTKPVEGEEPPGVAASVLEGDSALAWAPPSAPLVSALPASAWAPAGVEPVVEAEVVVQHALEALAEAGVEVGVAPGVAAPAVAAALAALARTGNVLRRPSGFLVEAVEAEAEEGVPGLAEGHAEAAECTMTTVSPHILPRASDCSQTYYPPRVAGQRAHSGVGPKGKPQCQHILLASPRGRTTACPGC